MSADSFAQGYSTFVAYLAEPALRALAVGCVAAIALAALRVKRVGARLMVWTGVLYVALAMPLLGAFLPRLPIGVPAVPMLQNLQARFHRATTAVQLVASASEPASGPLSTERTAPSSRNAFTASIRDPQRQLGPLEKQRFARNDKSATAGTRQTTFERKTQQTDRSPASAATSAGIALTEARDFGAALTPGADFERAPASTGNSRFVIPWVAIALAIYLLGVLILLARLLVGVLLSRRLDRVAQNIDDREALRLLRFRACFAGLAATPRLKESTMLSVPATVGVHRAAILLPSDWRSWGEQELDAILAHEVSHVARRDALTQHLSLVHRAIFWFSPLAWWLDRQLTELAEEASDEAALAGGADRTRYAETLLAFFAQLEAVRGRVWWQGVSMAKKSGSKAGRAERRVDRILAWRGAMSMKKSFVVMLIIFAAPLVFLAASVHPFVASAQDAPKTQHKSQEKSDNVIRPGGPKAPALPNAPKGGVASGVSGGVAAAAPVAPALANAPEGGVVTPAMPAAAPLGGVLAAGPSTPRSMTPPDPFSAPTAAGPVRYSIRPDAPEALVAPSARPALMPVPGASADAPIVPGPIASGSVTPSALTAPAMAPYASLTLVAPTAPFASEAPIARSQSTRVVVGDTEGDRTAEDQLRAAEKALRDAEKQVEASNAQVRVAQEALRKAQEHSLDADSAQLRKAEAALVRAEGIRAASERVRADHEARLAAAEQARAVLREVQDRSPMSNTIINGSISMGNGPRYVMMYGNANDVSMSGTDEDLEHARKLRDKLKTDLIWFERDEKSYVITDPGFIAKVKALFAPEDELSRQQDELSRQQDELSKQQDALGEQMDNVKVKVPDITPDLERVRERLKELQNGGATQSELGRLQSELGQLQSEVGRHQSEAGVQQSAIGRQQGELGAKQGELGRRQGELGRKQGEIAREASRKLRSMFDDAISKGIAKPE